MVWRGDCGGVKNEVREASAKPADDHPVARRLVYGTGSVAFDTRSPDLHGPGLDKRGE
jgi:hypothetical protein